jgi:hypothetical protein
VKRVTQFGWPRGFPVVQFPNLPLLAAFVSGRAAAMIHLAMAIWAYEELVHGVNWFRHLLGLVYVVSTAMHLARALGH